MRRQGRVSGDCRPRPSSCGLFVCFGFAHAADAVRSCSPSSAAGRVGRFRVCLMEATQGSAGLAGGFSPVGLVKRVGAVGPDSNTGQKVSLLHGALVDFLTVVFSESRLEECAATNLRLLLVQLFGRDSELVTSGRRGRRWQFYSDSCLIFDRNGENVGMIGLGGNGDTICISLSGAGCRWVRDWRSVVFSLEALQARITRCDVAYDDYDGTLLDVHQLREFARTGEGFCTGGRPPSSRFLDDHGSGEGCTLYVGGKGHKEACVYQKGRQLGDQSSPWVRAEVRLYAKHVERIPLDVLVRPLDFLCGAYPIFQRILRGGCDRLTTVVKTVEATAKAMVNWVRTQCGPTLHLLSAAFGDDFGAFLRQNVTRDQLPARFRRVGATAEHLPLLVRNELCASM